VVFSKALNPQLRALAFTGSYASVIGGSAAATVVFTREVRLRAAADPAVRRAREELRGSASAALREACEGALADATRDAQVAVAAEFDRVHTVERACRMRSLDGIIDPATTRPTLIRLLHEDGRRQPRQRPAKRRMC
jgi:acetyl-CoA carboxylase carboxyltransferase component